MTGNFVYLGLDDSREQITISTYGFLKNGLLQVDIKKLDFKKKFPKLDTIRDSVSFSYFNLCLNFLTLFILFISSSPLSLRKPKTMASPHSR